jgi:hypothetical protein
LAGRGQLVVAGIARGPRDGQRHAREPDRGL